MFQENGYVVAESDTGSGLVTIRERVQKFNDGKYHVVKYVRMGRNSTLQVNQLPQQVIQHTGDYLPFNWIFLQTRISFLF